MSKVFWQSKIWGLLHELAIKPPTSSNNDEQYQGIQRELEEWNLPNRLSQATCIASASDRALFDLIPNQHDAQQSVTISHLLSGEKLSLNYDWQAVEQLRVNIRQRIVNDSPLQALVPPEEATVDQLKQQFWWLWRCLPAIITQNDTAQLLTPATHILPDVSLWSQASLTSAMS
ncbi:MAG: hypothetical protein AAF327_12990, partial [Cyanobacteria bacterium P01_A01_bin.37]